MTRARPFAVCPWKFLQAGEKKNPEGGVDIGERDCQCQEALKIRN